MDRPRSRAKQQGWTAEYSVRSRRRQLKQRNVCALTAHMWLFTGYVLRLECRSAG
jgi:hypothetical protein